MLNLGGPPRIGLVCQSRLQKAKGGYRAKQPGNKAE
jgi:hypothetical protein